MTSISGNLIGNPYIEKIIIQECNALYGCPRKKFSSLIRYCGTEQISVSYFLFIFVIFQKLLSHFYVQLTLPLNEENY